MVVQKAPQLSTLKSPACADVCIFLTMEKKLAGKQLFTSHTDQADYDFLQRHLPTIYVNKK